MSQIAFTQDEEYHGRLNLGVWVRLFGYTKRAAGTTLEEVLRVTQKDYADISV